MKQELEHKESGIDTYSRLDVALAKFLTDQSQLDYDEKIKLEPLLVELSAQQSLGHSCVEIEVEAKNLLEKSGLVCNDQVAPLVVEDNRLYFHRYWSYEQRLAKQITLLLKDRNSVPDPEVSLQRYFNDATYQDNNQPREAARTALNNRLTIITGGPGTGKTTTVVKILALIMELFPQSLLMGLAAPTGKAALRLQQSINLNKENLPCTESICEQLPDTVHTIHRLLGSRHPSPYFHHHADNPLPFDVVVVDEASMIDLALMSKLVDALKPDARLILLGDQQQLASVESGSVLADLTSALPECTVELKHTYRFNEQIQCLSIAVNEQQAKRVLELLDSGHASVSRVSDDPISFVAKHQIPYLQLIKERAGLTQIFRALNQFQALCSNRHGRYGVIDINYQVESYLASIGCLNPNGTWYTGRPVMIIQNDASMQLYNGDIGICMTDPDFDDRLIVAFQQSNGTFRKFLPARLPRCETVFAMTIHKSQGSEFDEVLIILPERVNPILTKELLYTGITRSKRKVNVFAETRVLEQTVLARIRRFGGLAETILKHKQHCYEL